ncbi:MAG: hypothetical protein QOJ56_2509 [Mycobacterium sp.]|nr:hypothetical protein [Mycobacterium sp.]
MICLRKCDRDPDVEWLVSQPFRLSWAEPTLGSHTPDLLSVGVEGQVTVWDARRLDEQDDDFKMHADVARRCCGAVGWRYAVFSGLATIERLNLLWLHGFRRRPEWMHLHAELIRRMASGVGASLADLFARDDGSGELKSVVWHLVVACGPNTRRAVEVRIVDSGVVAEPAVRHGLRVRPRP